jgi:hypothetical protein
MAEIADSGDDDLTGAVESAIDEHSGAEPSHDAEPARRDDIGADLAAAIKEHETAEPAGDVERERKVSDRRTERPDEKADTKPETKQPKTAEGDEQPWSMKNAATFRSLPAAAQEHIRSMEKQTAEYAPVAKAFAPYSKEIEAAGTSPAKLIEGWSKLESQMTGPGKDAAFAAIAYRYGIDLKAMIGEYAQMPQRFAAAHEKRTATEQRGIQTAVDVFAKKYADFAELEQGMTQAATMGVGAGLPVAERLEKLREAAMWSSPTHRETMIAARNKAMSRPTPQTQPRTAPRGAGKNASIAEDLRNAMGGR